MPNNVARDFATEVRIVSYYPSEAIFCGAPNLIVTNEWNRPDAASAYATGVGHCYNAAIAD